MYDLDRTHHTRAPWFVYGFAFHFAPCTVHANDKGGSLSDWPKRLATVSSSRPPMRGSAHYLQSCAWQRDGKRLGTLSFKT